MFSGLVNMMSGCLKPTSSYAPLSPKVGGGAGGAAVQDISDNLLRHLLQGEHSCGLFSYAVLQANATIEDHSQVEVGPFGTFVGIYDGHGGPETSRFVRDNFHNNLLDLLREKDGRTSAAVIEKAFATTEDSWVKMVRARWLHQPNLAAVGSCCLVSVLAGDSLVVANLGDSRAVLGTSKDGAKVMAVQLTEDHNASEEAVRKELRAAHPSEPDVVVNKQGVWRVKGIIQVSRSIGDVYLKSDEFNREPLYQRFRLPGGLPLPVLSAVPTITERSLVSADKFVIFASDGLWEHLTNQEAVDFINRNPPNGAARRLVKEALAKASQRRNMSMQEIQNLGPGRRRVIHDDITVVVLFFDRNLATKSPDRKGSTRHVSVKDSDLGLDEWIPEPREALKAPA